MHAERGMGRRIVVWGVTGSGKTTLARRLGAALGLPVIELDAIKHARGWDSVGIEEMRAVLQRRLLESRDGWVIDGSYSAVHDLYLPHVDTVVWLNLPWRVSFARLFRRTVSRAWTREPNYHEQGPRESWSLTFLSRRSILWWSISRHRHTTGNVRRRIAALAPEIAVYELRSGPEVARFLDELPIAPGRG